MPGSKTSTALLISARWPVWRKFVDIHRAQGSAIADEAIGRIAQFYAVEKEARGSPPDGRVELWKTKAKQIFDDLGTWLHAQ